LDYLLYRSFSKDTDSANQTARGTEYYKMFISAIASKMGVDSTLSNPTKAPQA
jgi:hypothetical protein